MKKIIYTLLVFIGFQSLLSAQETKSDFGIKFSGFVKNDFFYDTRQVTTIREGHFALYPKNEELDANGKDINAAPNFNFLSIQSRLTGKITAPDAFGAKISGVLEADFFGNENGNFADVNGFRLRHAIVKMKWSSTELLFGQYWNPFFQTSCYSGVISFNTGVPMQPFSRNPQIRITQYFGNLSFMAALHSQRDFTSPGGSTTLRNSGMPVINAGLEFKSSDEATKNEFVAGFVGEYKNLKPADVTYGVNGEAYISDELITTMSGTAFCKIKIAPITWKLQAVYGQNLFDLVMLGGYVVDELIDANTNAVSYQPIQNMAVWSEIHSNGENLQVGLWGGYTKNLGAKEDILVYTPTVRGGNIESVMRISPRIVFISGKLKLAFEPEFTQAAYATFDENGAMNRDVKGVITDSKSVSNVRALFSVILSF